MSSITKILFRRGTDIVRRQAGGIGVVLNLGEPGVTVDTHRLYVGDGSRVGGWPAGIKNHGVFPAVFGSYNGYDPTTYAALTSNGIDIGDIVYDNSTNVMYYVSAHDIPFNLVPPASALTRFNLVGRVSAYNGLSADKINEYAQFGLDPAIFSVDSSSYSVYRDTIIGTSLVNRDLTVHGSVIITSNATVGGDLGTTGNFSTFGYVSGVTIYAGTGLAGKNSNSWYNAWTTTNTNSAAWNSVYTYVNTLTPFPMNWSGASPNFRVAINSSNLDFTGLLIKGANTTSTALSVVGAIEATGDITAFTTSDSRLKKDVTPIAHALDKIDQITGIDFTWDCDFKSGRDVGVLAQEVEQVFPQVVITRPDGFKAVDYPKLIPLLIQAIKELNQKLK